MKSCPKCGFEFEPETTECPACGIVLKKFRPSTEVATPAAPVPPPVEASGRVPTRAGPVAVITPATLDAFSSARPWIRFLVGYGYVVGVLMLLGGVELFISGFWRSDLMLAGLLYLVYSVVAFGILLPLRRSVEALRQVPSLGGSAALEAFAIHQTAFWRRMGVVTAVAVGIAAVGIVIALVFGMLAAASR
jgi:hypothetical protein